MPDAMVGSRRTVLSVALGKIAEIERTLEVARDAARAAARRAGISGAYVFESTSFIPRSTGHRWKDQGIEQGHAERDAVFLKVAEAVRNPDPKYAGVANQLRRMRIAAGCSPTEDRPGDGARIAAYMSMKGPMRGEGAEPEADDLDAIAAETEARAETTAAAILRAAAKARAVGPPMPEPTGKAARILAAARKAHRRMGDDQ
jgi:hypothetical protein